MEGNKLAEARRLWQMIFEDDDVFCDFYFTYCATAEETYLRYSADGIAVGHIGLPTYRLGLPNGAELSTLYISGACVDDRYRGRGMMSQMMTDVVRATATDALMLIPASEGLRRYYERLGFGSTGFRRRTPDPQAVVDLGVHLEATTPEGLLYEWRAGEVGVRHTLAQCQNVLREYQLYNESTALYRQDSRGLYVGMCLGHFADDVLRIEVLIGNTSVRASLIQELEERYRPKHYNIYMSGAGASPRDGTEPCHGMLRPISPMAMLRAYQLAHPTQELTLGYIDPLLPEQSGTYTLAAGAVHYAPKLPTTSDMPTLSPQELVEHFIPALDIHLMHD